MTLFLVVCFFLLVLEKKIDVIRECHGELMLDWKGHSDNELQMMN